MQSRHRLKLAVVLLMAAGLMGGVACWNSSEPPLNAEERRLVGRWEYAINGGFPEYHPNRNLTYEQNDDSVRHQWRVTGDVLTISFSSGGTFIFLPPNIHYEIVRLLPFVDRFARPYYTAETQFRVLWHDDDMVELVTTDKEQSENDRSNGLLMRRAPAVK